MEWNRGEDRKDPCWIEASRLQGGASRQGMISYIIPLAPAYPALAGWGTFRSNNTL
jgi:hypothetical protein